MILLQETYTADNGQSFEIQVISEYGPDIMPCTYINGDLQDIGVYAGMSIDEMETITHDFCEYLTGGIAA